MIPHTKLSKGLSLVEILGAVAVIATVATVSVISVKDTVLAGQRSAAQKELQHLNSALQNYRSAGGAVPSDSSAQDVVNLLKEGVDLSGSDFTPLTSDPALTRDIAGMPYSLEYDDAVGFTYEPEDGSGLILAGAGSEQPAGGAGGTFPFDVNDPAAAQAALEQLATLEPGSEEYNALLAGLNAANLLGNLSDAALAGAGLIEQGGQWKNPAEANALYAQEAQTLLNGGSTWNDLSEAQQVGYANVYPSQAVSLAGAKALNLMDSSILTPELVSGYVLNTDTWTAPQLNGGAITSQTFAEMEDWDAWGTKLVVVRVIDPLLPAEIVGYITPNRTVSLEMSGGFTFTIAEDTYSYSYAVELAAGVTGVTLDGDTSFVGEFTIGGGTLGGGGITLGGGGLATPTPTPVPSPTPITSLNPTGWANFETSEGQIYILPPN